MLTTLAEVQAQIQKFWAPKFMAQLREQLLLGTLVNKDYDGEIKKMGDTVTVSQINAPEGETLTVGTDADTFSTEALSTSYVDIKADKRFVAAYEFQDLVAIQSMIDKENPEVMAALNYAVQRQVNKYLYSLVNPSTATPDHLVGGITNFNASELGACRVLSAQAKWLPMPGWYGLLSPSYYQDQLNATTLVSSDYGATDAPTISGQLALKRFGYQLLEDNSDAILEAGNIPTSGTDVGLLFHPDFCHLVMQTVPQIKISDQHANKRFGFIMSVDIIGGAKLGIDGDKKHILVYNT